MLFDGEYEDLMCFQVCFDCPQEIRGHAATFQSIQRCRRGQDKRLWNAPLARPSLMTPQSFHELMPIQARRMIADVAGEDQFIAVGEKQCKARHFLLLALYHPAHCK